MARLHVPVARTLRAAALATPFLLASTVSAQSGTRMLRSPSVSGQSIAFAYANNIWVVERTGGAARRLTSFQGVTQNPKLSPDGRLVAFSAEYAGNTDAYVVPVEGGQPTRLTWHPSADVVQGWTPDGKNVVFASPRATWAPSAAPRFWSVPATGGVETAMPMPRAYQGKISSDGKRIAYRMASSWDEERRNYRGGQNKPIWILDLATFALDSTPFTGSKEMDPVWVGDAVYFLSDRDGVSNVWSYDTKARALKQITTFKDFDVKTLDAAGNSVVFEQAGYVHELDARAGTHKIVNITAAGDFPWMMPQWKDVTSRATGLALSATGKRAAVEARGEVFTVPAEKGDVRNLTNSSASAEIAPVWSPDGKSIAWFSDRSGEYQLVIAPQEGVGATREIALPEPSRPYSPSWSPDGKTIAFQDTHFRIWLVDVASGKAKVADTDPYFMMDRSIVPVWSPDSRYLAYPKRLKSLLRAIFVYEMEGGAVKQLTDGMADASNPAWDASGKYLWFLASTNFALNSSLLDMSKFDRPETRALYLAVLSKSEPSPLLPESDDEAGRDSTRSVPRAADTTRTAPAPVRPVRIDYDAIAQRILAVQGITERDYEGLRAGPAGTVFFLEPIPATGTGAAGGGQGGSGNTLHRYQLGARRAAVFAQGVAQFTTSGDGRRVLYRTTGANGALFLVDGDRAIPTAGTGRLNATLRAFVDPKAEFRQIFNEGWRNQRNNLYVKNMQGTDWPAMKKMYEPLLAHVNHRADLNYLLDNMGAEIAIGHSYVRGGDLPEVPDANGGLLGADFAIENGRYRLSRIYDAESWNPELRAPLVMPGVNVARGDYILAINGQELRAPENIYRLLDGTANRQTVLTVNSRPDMQGARQVTVVPVGNEQGLRTRAWVEHNRRVVDSLSGGKIAYVYVPNTGQPGYVSFNRYYFAQQDRVGVVVDERYNGGGSAADYIVDMLGRDYDGYFNNPVGDRYPYTSPANGIWGPKVMIINEMAGSGGDLMPFMFKRRKLGPLVGARTWGGLVATTDTPPFVDGGSMIAPRFGFFSRDPKFAVENEGVAPDIDVENFPREVISGRDPQLERAVQEAMRLLGTYKNDRANQEPDAPVWGRRGR
ncbi:MAG TPA: PDZ domain-containing protein [Gemmatimonas sp.]|uniref:S41 family peptidase n=1 Tax=Gemmatimonas sp. TaxID=1962908 RepID=UPI002ED8EC8F